MNRDPQTIFSSWHQEAQSGALLDPSIIALATADKRGRPSVRMVLFRGFREGGFSFFTNYESRKGRDLSENPFAAIVFYWSHLGKQIRIEGSIERLSPAESDSYFHQRPLESQITAAASDQSRPLLDEAAFIAGIHEIERAGSIERPAYWGGYKIIPNRYEFWTQGEHRRHSRFLFERDGDGWIESKLYP